MTSDNRIPRALWLVSISSNIYKNALVFSLALFLGVAHAAGEDAAVEAQRAFVEAMLAMETGQWAQAEMYLERCLMFEPDHADARLQLAILMAQRGRVDTARALIESLIDDPRTPPAHRERLQTLLNNQARLLAAMPESPTAVGPPTQTGAEITLGYVRNPFARAAINELTLTLPGGDLTLPILQDVKPAPLVGLTVRHAVLNEWGFEANVQQFGAPEPRTAGRLWLFRDTVISAQPVRWSAYFLRSIDGTTRQAVGITIPQDQWRLLAGVFNEPQARRGGLTARLERAWIPLPSVQTIAYWEAEYATFGRAGYGGAGVYTQWVPFARWMLAGQVSAYRDFEGYSPWLNNNEPRRMVAANVAVEHFWEPGADWRVLGRAYVGQRWSNLALFGYKDAGVLISLQRYWR